MHLREDGELMNTSLAALKKRNVPKPPQRQTLHFQIKGNYITEFIRNLCLEGNPIHAWKVFSTITEDEEIFRSIVKGEKSFSGTNEFRLKPSKRKSVVEDTFLTLQRGKRSQIEQDRFSFSSDFREEDEEEFEEFDTKSYNENIEREEIKRTEQINFFAAKMNLTLAQVEDMLLKTRASEQYDHPYGGWITEKGHFLPVDYCQHDNYFYSLVEAGVVFSREVGEIERRWVRVSTDLNVMRGMNLAAYHFNMTPKQKITVEKILKARSALTREGQEIMVLGYGRIYLEDGQIKFEREED